MARKMKPSGIEWIGEVPEEWEVKKLKYVAQFQPFCDISGLTEDSTITYTPMEFIKNGYYINNTARLGNVPPSLTPYTNGDIVIAKVTPCFENGNIAIMDNLASGFGLGSSELFVIRPQSINTKYLFYWLQNDLFIQQGKATMTGTGGLKRVSPYFVNNCPIAFPPLAEQQRIANFLDAQCGRIDETVEKTRATIGEYKKLKQSLITQAVTKVTKGLRPHRPMKDSKSIWFGSIPSNWNMEKIKYLFKIKKDIAGEEGHTVLSITQKGIIPKDLTKNEGQLAENYINYQLVNIGDFAMNHMDLLTGWVDISSHNGVTSPDYRVFVISDKLKCSSKYYLYVMQMCYFNRIFYGLGQGVSGLGRWRLQADKFLNFYVPIPPHAEQQEITDYLDKKTAEIDALVAKKEALAKELEAYKKSLIYEYVTGKASL